MACKLSITPITGPTIAWDVFLKDTVRLTGHSPARGTDASGQNFKEYARFIVALEEFRASKPLDPIETLGNAESALRHLQFSFLVMGTSELILRISESTGLHVISARLQKKSGRLAFVSGTLSEWKAAIVEVCATTNYSADMRRVANACLEVFYSSGLEPVFRKYSRRSLPDQTYLLEYNP